MELEMIVESAPKAHCLSLSAKERMAGQSSCVRGGGDFLKTNLMHESIDFVDRFTERGIIYAVLKYRLPQWKTGYSLVGCPLGIEDTAKRIS